MNKKEKKRPVTLIEIMIVILLIGLIGGALAYNMAGSMDEGKAFKTRQNIEKLHDILIMESIEKDISLDEVVTNAQNYINRSSLLNQKQKSDILYDGWKTKLDLNVVNGDIVIRSSKLERYEQR